MTCVHSIIITYHVCDERKRSETNGVASFSGVSDGRYNSHVGQMETRRESRIVDDWYLLKRVYFTLGEANARG